MGEKYHTHLYSAIIGFKSMLTRSFHIEAIGLDLQQPSDTKIKQVFKINVKLIKNISYTISQSIK